MEYISPPLSPPTEPSPAPPRATFLDRWIKRPEAKTPVVVEAEPKEQGRLKRFARNVLNVVHPPKTEAAEPKNEQRDAQEMVQETRTFGRRVLNFVMNVAERPTPEPKAAEPLHEAADDLREALHELNTVAPEERADHSPAPAPQPTAPEHAYTGGDGDGLRTPEAPAPEPLQPHITEVQRKLETSKEKLTHALAVAGMGVIGVGAVLAIGHHYLKHKHQHRDLNKHQHSENKVLARQQEQLAEQRQALQKLQQPQPERPQLHYYQEVSNLAHRQANITREVVREVQRETPALHAPEPLVPLTHAEAMAEPITEQFHIPKQQPETPNRLAPAARIERGTSVERPRALNGQTAMHAGGGAVAPGVLVQQNPQQQTATSPQAANDIRQAIIQKAKPKPHLWLFGLALIIVFLAIIILIIMF